MLIVGILLIIKFVSLLKKFGLFVFFKFFIRRLVRVFSFFLVFLWLKDGWRGVGGGLGIFVFVSFVVVILIGLVDIGGGIFLFVIGFNWIGVVLDVIVNVNIELFKCCNLLCLVYWIVNVLFGIEWKKDEMIGIWMWWFWMWVCGWVGLKYFYF